MSLGRSPPVLFPQLGNNTCGICAGGMALRALGAFDEAVKITAEFNVVKVKKKHGQKRARHMKVANFTNVPAITAFIRGLGGFEVEKVNGDINLLAELIHDGTAPVDEAIVACIRDNFGANNHVVAIFKEHIFDSNFKHAHPLSQLGFDKAASGPGETRHKCENLTNAIRIKISKKRRAYLNKERASKKTRI